MKKLFAILMTMAMVMGLSITGFAAAEPVTDIKSDIKVTGLSSDVTTTIKVYQYATLYFDEETNEYSWEIADWARNSVGLNADETAYVISNPAALKLAAEKQVPLKEITTKETSYTFEDMLIGGYIIIPSDTAAQYEPLFAVNTYDRTVSPGEDGRPVAIDIEVAAKSETHTIGKDQDDDFVQIGETVDYTVKATFPMSEDSEGNELSNFVITDTPVGLNIDVNSVKVTLAGEDITNRISKNVDDTSGVLTVDFGNVLNDVSKHDGEDIVITYTATVTATEYNNSVSATSDTTDYTPGRVDGDNGSIEITKVDAENQELLLTGVEFEVYDLGDKTEWTESNPGTAMSLVYDAEKGEYRPAIGAEEGAVTTIATKETESVDDDSKLKIVGLDEGYYYFKETKAPNGYAINKDGLTVQIVKDENEDLTVKFLNTKMAELPETGGMGTTLFTIAGCVIMISAAGLFFATRKKAN